MAATIFRKVTYTNLYDTTFNEKIKRKSRVAQSFPSERSLAQLVEAVCVSSTVFLTSLRRSDLRPSSFNITIGSVMADLQYASCLSSSNQVEAGRALPSIRMLFCCQSAQEIVRYLSQIVGNSGYFLGAINKCVQLTVTARASRRVPSCAMVRCIMMVTSFRDCRPRLVGFMPLLN